MIEMNDNLKLSILVVLVSSYILYEKKPECLFNRDGSFKSFGLKEGSTPFSFTIVITIIGFTTYYLLILKNGKYV